MRLCGLTIDQLDAEYEDSDSLQAHIADYFSENRARTDVHLAGVAAVLTHPVWLHVEIAEDLAVGSSVSTHSEPCEQWRQEPEFDSSGHDTESVELPVLLLDEQIVAPISKELKATLDVIVRMQRYGVFPKAKSGLAFRFLLVMHLIFDGAMRAARGRAPYWRANIVRPNVAGGDIVKRLRDMSHLELARLVQERTGPAYCIEELLVTWRSFGQSFAASLSAEIENDSCVWVWNTIPPFPYSIEELQERHGRVPDLVGDPHKIFDFETRMAASLTQELIKYIESRNHKEVADELALILTEFRTQKEKEYCRFTRHGDFWLVAFDGKCTFVKHSIGMSYISICIASRPSAVASVTLASIPANRKAIREDRSKFQSHRNEDAADQENDAVVSQEGSAVPEKGSFERVDGDDSYNKIDAKEITDIKARIRILGHKIETAGTSADRSEFDRLVRERTKLKDFLKANRNRRGKPRTFDDKAEHDRKSVSKAVKKAIKSIRDSEMHSLADHLESSLKVGGDNLYTPDSDLRGVL